MATVRCTPAERKVFRQRFNWFGQLGERGSEPALGTLEQRLDIVCRRLGVPGPVRLTAAERAELLSYQLPTQIAA